MSQPTDTQRWAETLIAELVSRGVTTVCLSPGSRSTPLVAAAVSHGGLEVVTHVDERGAAFFCLGYARATGRPAIWLTTSGTAVANGLPAVVEASMDAVPMICLTADRPAELRGTGANQTIVQPGIFGVYPRYAVDLAAPGPNQPADPVRDAVAAAYGHAMGVPAGPVHINMSFRKPLEPEAAFSAGSATTSEDAASVTGVLRSTPEALDLLALALNATPQRGVVLAGRMNAPTAVACQELAAHLGWPLLPDIGSQLRLGSPGPRFITHADLLAGHVPAPDLVIQVGRMPVSQRLTRFLASARPAVWAVLADGEEVIDPHLVATHREGDAGPACVALTALVQARPDAAFVEAWVGAEQTLRQRLPAALEEGGLSEPAVASAVVSGLPAGHGLVLASSMPVRDANSFAPAAPPAVSAPAGAAPAPATEAAPARPAPDPATAPAPDPATEAAPDPATAPAPDPATEAAPDPATEAAPAGTAPAGTAPAGSPPAPAPPTEAAPARPIEAAPAAPPAPPRPFVAANRGASGIDGTLSTAAGVAQGLNAPVTLLIGDLAFLHDINGLALIRDRAVTVVLVNNNGGGIFSFLPIAEHPALFEPYFGVPHGMQFASAAQLYGIPYRAPTDLAEFRQVYARAATSGHAHIIEVRTERGENREEHRRLSARIAEWLQPS